MTGVLTESERKWPHAETPATRRQAEAAAMPASPRDAWGHGSCKSPPQARPGSHPDFALPASSARRERMLAVLSCPCCANSQRPSWEQDGLSTLFPRTDSRPSSSQAWLSRCLGAGGALPDPRPPRPQRPHPPTPRGAERSFALTCSERHTSGPSPSTSAWLYWNSVHYPSVKDTDDVQVTLRARSTRETLPAPRAFLPQMAALT